MLKIILFLIIATSKTGLTMKEGTEVHIKERPYQVAINTNYWKYLFAKCHCGGTIISKNYVLTAAHCVDKDQEYVVRAGSSECTWYGTIYRIKTKVIHPNFIKNPFPIYDLAILEMNKEIKFTEFVKPIAMAEKGLDWGDFIVEMSGYGKSKCCEEWENCPYNKQLSKIRMKMATTEICEMSSNHLLESRSCYENFDSYSMTCCGDAGGPVTLVNDNKLILHGIISFDHMCAPGGPTFSSYIPDFREWISSITNL